MPANTLSSKEIHQIQDLFTLRVPKAQIARHFKTSTALVAYHTRNLPQHSIDDIIPLAMQLHPSNTTHPQHQHPQHQHPQHQHPQHQPHLIRNSDI